MSFSRRIAAAFVAAATLLAPLAPAAQAQDRNMVIFGDSVISDPNMGQWAAGKLGLDPRGRSDNGTWCPTSPTNWGKRSAAKLGLAARDYSCTGVVTISKGCLLYTSPSPRDLSTSRMPSSA